MPTQVKATLLYGYFLGCPNDGGWEVEEAGFDGMFEPPWHFWDPERPDNAMTMALLAHAGAPLEEMTEIGTLDHRELLNRYCGVRVVVHGHPEALRYSLACARSVFETREWKARRLNPTLPEDQDLILEAALEALGIEPLQASPFWMLAASHE